MDIVVLAGGLSYERDVSLSSGGKIATALEEKGHSVLLLDIYLGMDANNFEEALQKQTKNNKNRDYSIGKKEPALENLTKFSQQQNDLVGNNVISICKSADFCFLALHGGIGENGKLQALFDIYNIKYSGSDYKSSLLAMDKEVSKKLMVSNHILTPNWEMIDSFYQRKISAPCVVKPIDNGSSIGVEMVEEDTHLDEAVKAAEKFQSKIMIEEKITGREFSVGILGDSVLPVIEIIPKHGFYNYENKYQEGATTEITPAEISEELTKKLSDLALLTHNTLGLSVYSRIDFMVTSEFKIYCIEANSLPGMTPTSLLPQEAAAHGIHFSDLCEKIVQFSLDKYNV
ncbi:D-alanine--D-alanine ligase [Tetragenococcus halophilus subsp. halophilus]|uniref:D-alanine--D-alanine ligase family protein n=1 Tax=Tetragenococcus halophilus TaxID=51669 RepID=UPI000CB102BD|nr:D-alanine--D-alanine ligase [Tetragenococcus halophilus]NWO00822.1 D-alanine--D-alanine ligase [Tetragenococcus halophilus]WJS81839.1 D-alanine--D-alanine ligase [Tetragenococcus halophilus]GBD73274.1 D-alanine--D-alanine ligase [Tetragenococcus halophilus subsp. halophilus]GBD76361.1 D-alanine--D-alanine ligase [Tetragenococcus halophilus subsp. halophilus]GBD81238.1 D-alanine--D-alanine ligase [Tetragenococcus halophilus subsp. halophilus]